MTDFHDYRHFPDNQYAEKLQKLAAEQSAKLVQARDELIKQCLERKGFGHLIEGIERRMFSKLAAIHYEGWTYVYADNDTVNGAFIVAIEDVGLNTEWKWFETGGINFTASFRWQDCSPPDLSRFTMRSNLLEHVTKTKNDGSVR